LLITQEEASWAKNRLAEMILLVNQKQSNGDGDEEEEGNAAAEGM
jgi:hypothetical protein